MGEIGNYPYKHWEYKLSWHRNGHWEIEQTVFNQLGLRDLKWRVNFGESGNASD